MSKSILRTGRPSASTPRQRTLTELADSNSLVRVNFEIREDLRTKLRTYAAKRNMTVRDVLTRYIETLPE